MGPEADHRRVEVALAGHVQGVGFRPWLARRAAASGVGGWVENHGDGVRAEFEGEAAAVAALLDDLRPGGPAPGRIEHTLTTELTGAEPPVARRAGPGRTPRDPPPPTLEIRPGSPVGRTPNVPVDLATCPECVAELLDPSDRRYRHPFISCASCGPRSSILRALPWDRSTTTMAGFPLCTRCREEFTDPDDRRFHAETICCPACGPTLWAEAASGPVDGDPVVAAVAVLASGGVVCVKGIGGFHLLCDATDTGAIERVRDAKRRPDQPLAVLTPLADWVRRATSATDRELLTSPAAPIVVLDAPRAPLSPAVAPGGGRQGIMMASAPVHHLLLADLGRPLVCTSANRTGAPLVHLDEIALTWLGTGADLVVGHDRDISLPVDDSVVLSGRDGPPLPVRRGRGWAPDSRRIPPADRPARAHSTAPPGSPTTEGPNQATAPTTDRPTPAAPPATDRPVPAASRRAPDPVILGCGAHLKATVCLLGGDRAVLGAHIGDLGSAPTVQAYADRLRRLVALTGSTPDLLAVDLHPEAGATAAALALAQAEGWPAAVAGVTAVQHHRAHLVSCMIDNDHPGPALGIVLDGLGWGDDDTFWGGEILLESDGRCARLGHLAPVPLPGGEAAVRRPWRMAVAYLDAAVASGRDPSGAAARSLDRLVADHPDGAGVRSLCAGLGPAVPLTSGVGRLLDAAACLIIGRAVTTFEAQAVTACEEAAAAGTRAGHRDEVPLLPLPTPGERADRRGRGPSGPPAKRAGAGSSTPGRSDGLRPAAHVLGGQLDGAGFLADIAHRLELGHDPDRVAAAAHCGLARGFAGAAARAAELTGVEVVALSGGVMANRTIADALTDQLAAAGLRVLRHRSVPANDGGISLGQAVVAKWAAAGP